MTFVSYKWHKCSVMHLLQLKLMPFFEDTEAENLMWDLKNKGIITDCMNCSKLQNFGVAICSYNIV